MSPFETLSAKDSRETHPPIVLSVPPLRPNSSGGFPSADTAVSRKIFSPKTVGLECPRPGTGGAIRLRSQNRPVAGHKATLLGAKVAPEPDGKDENT